MPLRRATERGQRGAARERDLAHLANKSFDVQGQNAMQAPAPLQSVLTAALPAAADWPGAILYVSDAAAGAKFQGSDGSTWGPFTTLSGLSPLTTRGDLLTRDATTHVRLAVGAANTVLKSNGTDPAWATIATANIANDAVTYAKIQNVSATDKVLGRSSAGAGDVQEITCTAAGRALIDDATAAAQATTLSLGIGDSPTFTALTLSDGQIVFPATQVPSAGANTLDDYEEGTWTPADNSGAALSLAGVVGTYTKIGREVFVYFQLTYPATADASNASISGLPFTSSSAVNGGGPKVALTDYAVPFTIYLAPSATVFDFRTFGNVNLTNANLSGKTIYAGGSYQV